MGKLIAETERGISPGNPKIHRVILLVYLTIPGPFPENKLHSMEMGGGCIFVPQQQSPKDAGQEAGKNCSTMESLSHYDGPGLPPSGPLVV